MHRKSKKKSRTELLTVALLLTGGLIIMHPWVLALLVPVAAFAIWWNRSRYEYHAEMSKADLAATRKAQKSHVVALGPNATGNDKRSFNSKENKQYRAEHHIPDDPPF